jgi:hypothetical protein
MALALLQIIYKKAGAPLPLAAKAPAFYVVNAM